MACVKRPRPCSVSWACGIVVMKSGFKIRINEGHPDPNKSAVIQEFLFDRGCYWVVFKDADKNKIQKTQYPYLYVRGRNITCGSDHGIFRRNPLPLADFSHIEVEDG